MFTFAHGFLNGTETLALHAATYNASTYLVGDETVSGTPTFVHTSTIYALCSDSYYHSFGVNKRVVKNGRYIDEDTVYADNGSGILLDSLPMTVYQKAAQNDILYSKDYSNSVWEKHDLLTVAKDAIDLEGVSNGAYTLTDASTTDQGALEQVLTISSNTLWYTIVFYVAKDSDTSRAIGVGLALSDFTTYFKMRFNTSDGSYINHENFGTTDLKIIDISEASWKVCMAVQNESKTAMYIEAIPAVGPDINTSSDATTGSVAVCNIEVYADAEIVDVEYLPPIFTTTTAESTDEIINTYPAANWSNNEGPIYLIHDYKGIDEVILLNDGVAILYVTSDVLYLNDGTNTASIAYSVEGEHEIGIVLDTTGNKMKLNLDGTYSTEANYDNSFGTGDITVEADIREYKRKDESSYIAQQTILDGWMP